MTSTAERVARATSKKQLNEDSLALLFSETHKNKLRYVNERGEWLMYDGTRWKQETTLLAFHLVRELCRKQVEACEGPASYKSPKVVAGVEKFARSDRRQAMTLEEFDADPWLLNCENGTVDLKTGELRAHNPDNYISKRTGCAVAEKGTPHPLFDKFLDRITKGNAELQQFFQRLFGYALSGDTSEDKFAYCYGTGRNGKGTLINTVTKIMGDYAVIASPETFMLSKSERHLAELACLQGARLVTAQEVKRGATWDEARVKMLTGGDPISARYMRQNPFTFVPCFKLVMSGNLKPSLETVDPAMQARLLFVSFTVEIPASERDPKLRETLPREEGPAILRWLIDGCLEWQRIGLAPPLVVTEASAKYFAEQDLIGQWQEECTQPGKAQVATPGSVLFASWSRWCQGRGAHPQHSKWFYEMLENRGLKKSPRGKKGVGFHGIEVAEVTADTPEEPRKDPEPPEFG